MFFVYGELREPLALISLGDVTHSCALDDMRQWQCKLLSIGTEVRSILARKEAPTSPYVYQGGCHGQGKSGAKKRALRLPRECL